MHPLVKNFGQIHILDDADSFVSNVVKVVIGQSQSDGKFAVEYFKPQWGELPLGHAWTAPPAIAAKTKSGAGPGGCSLCDSYQGEHLPDVSGWVGYVHLLEPGEALPKAAGTPLPRNKLRQIGEALIKFADQAEGKPAKPDEEVGAQHAHVLAEALVHERDRTSKLLDAIIGIATGDAASPGAPTLDFSTSPTDPF